MNTENIPVVQGEVEPTVPEAEASDADNLEAQLQLLLNLRGRTEELEALLDAAKQAEGNAERALIDAMLGQGVENFRALGKSVTRVEDIKPSVLAADRPKQMEWLREIGLGHMISETVNTSSFNALIRNEFVKAGKPLPDFVRVWKGPKLLVRGA